MHDWKKIAPVPQCKYFALDLQEGSPLICLPTSNALLALATSAALDEANRDDILGLVIFHRLGLGAARHRARGHGAPSKIAATIWTAVQLAEPRITK
jgi:hypothetical protein